MEEQKKYYLQDIETGDLVEVSKEAHDLHHAAMKQISKSVAGNLKGTIFFSSTVADLNGNNDEMRELWTMNENPSNFKLIDWPKDTYPDGEKWTNRPDNTFGEP